jgi:hypothetical protein
VTVAAPPSLEWRRLRPARAGARALPRAPPDVGSD